MAYAKRRTREEWQKLVAAWEKSGQSRREFSAEHGLNPRTLAWYRTKLKNKPLVLVRVQTTSETQEPWEIVVPSGAVVRVPPNGAAVRAAELVKALLEVS